MYYGQLGQKFKSGNIYGQIAGMYYALSDYHFLNDDGSTAFNKVSTQLVPILTTILVVWVLALN